MRLPAIPVHSFEDATLNAEALQKLLTLPAWTAPTLTNAWVNAGAPYETAGYLKDGLGFVRLKGVIKSGANNTIAFTLPVGYRPGATALYAAGQGGATTWAIALIDTTGAVTLQWLTANTLLGLSGITFRAEN